MHLRKSADSHHQTAEGQSTRKIDRCGNKDRSNNGEPAIACRDPCQIGCGNNNSLDGNQHRVKIQVQPAALISLASCQCNSIDMLIHPHQREAKIGLARIAVGIVINETAANKPGQQRRRTRIKNRRPNHIARYGKTITPKMEYKAARQRPQDANKADENDGGLQQIDAKIARSLGKMTRIFLQSLVRVDANFASFRKTECPPRLQPLTHQIARQSFS